MQINYNSSDQELSKILDSNISSLQAEGYTVEFGYIGKRTTYCFLHRDGVEVVGYTYIRGDISNKRDIVGKLKALFQATNRKYLLYDSIESESKGV